MGIAELGKVLKIFGGSEISDSDKEALFHEVLLMVLSRASSSDSSIQSVEIRSIQRIIERETGNKISDQDVRKAARTELYETTPLDKYLSSVSRKLASQDRVKIVHLLADVIRSDTEISVLEIDFFNKVASALNATPAEIAGISKG